MYYELLILGRLMYGAFHGYFIADVISDMIGPWQRVSTGTLYPLLARLERDGLIDAVAPRTADSSRRTARAYGITTAGRARFLELMLDTTSSIGDYQRLFRLKVPHLEFLTADQRDHVLEHYRDYCRAGIRHQAKNVRDLAGWRSGLVAAGAERDEYGMTLAGFEHAIATAQHMADQWQAELTWVEQLLTHER